MGFWGKIPARGDFVRWGLPREFLEPWDEWLGGVVVGARQFLGEAWDAAWDVASPCRFLLAPGLCGPWQVAGVWLPSRDRVGRAYPLTFAMEVWEDAAPFYVHAEGVGQAALQEGLDPAALRTRLLEPCLYGEVVDPPLPLPVQGSLWRQGRAWSACAGMPEADMFASLMFGWKAV